MQNIFSPIGASLAMLSCLIVTGCHTQTEPSHAASTPAQPALAAAPVAAETAKPLTVAEHSVFRVKAGLDKTFTDSSGNLWQPDQGFDGGDVTERDPGTAITNTKDPALYLTEHYGMNSFSCKIPNGKYTAKLHFAETFEGITGPGERVFSYAVQGHKFDDFDIWAKTGGSNRAYVEAVPVEVTNGIFRIEFTSKVENPEINAIEIIPQS